MAVTPATIAVALGKAAPDSGSTQEQQWAMWIADATRAIDRRAAKLGVDPATLNAEDVDEVVRKAVVAHVRNPDDATQVTVAIDDASSSRTYRSSSGEVAIRDSWWADLGLVEDEGAFTIQTYGEPDPLVTESWA